MNSKAIRKQLFAAVAMVLVAAVALGSSTYAWFANNNKVTATGLKATAQTGSSALLIAVNESGISDKNFQTAVKLSTTAQKLAPVSTIDGKNFYYTLGTNVNGAGDAINETYIKYDEGADATNDSFPSGAVPYVQYDLLLKATLDQTATIDLTKLALDYTKSDKETDNENAFRVAFFASTEQTSVTAAKEATVSLVSIMNSQNTTTNFTPGQAVNSETTTGTVTKPGANAQVTATVTPSKDVYYRVIVKLWIEGEDITCTNTIFNPLAGEWNLGLEFMTNGTAVKNYTAGGAQPSGNQSTGGTQTQGG